MATLSIPLKRPPFRQSAKRSWAAKLTLLTAIGVVLDAAPTFQLRTAPFGLFAKQPAAARGGVFSGRTVGWNLGFQQMGSRIALAADYNSMKAAELKDICKSKGLPVSGTKPVLIARIEEAEGASASEDKEDSKEPEKPASKAPAEKPPEKPESMVPAGKPRGLGYEPGTKVAVTPGLTTDKNRNVVIEPGDRVMARYHRDHRMYAGIVLDIQDHKDAYLISWDEPDQYEPLSSCKEVQLTKKAKVKLEGGEKQLFHVGDKVQVRFPMDNSWYDAEITGVGRVEREEWEIKWKDPDGTPPVQIKVAKDLHLIHRAKHACQ